MSLILKGSSAGSVYAQQSGLDASGSSAISVYTRVVAADNCAAPFVFLYDGDLDSSARGFFLRQDTPTQMTVGWIAAGGTFEHSFAVESGVFKDVLAVYDINAEIVNIYIDSSTPAETFSSVGAPVDTSVFQLRVASSRTDGEDVRIGDLAVWSNGLPDSVSLSAINDREYLGYAFKDSGCTERYLFVGDKTDIATDLFYNVMNNGNHLAIERDSAPSCTTGDFLPAPAVIATQSSSAIPTYFDNHDFVINRAKVTKIEGKAASNQIISIDEMIAAGHYEPKTGVWSSLPERYEGMPSYLTMVVEHLVVNETDDVNPELYSGTWVLEWEGNGVMDARGITSKTVIGPNRIEFEFGGGFSAFGYVSIPEGGSISNVRCYKKEFEPILDSGRYFTPVAVEQWARYDTIRMMDCANVNLKYRSKFDETNSIYGSWQTELPVAAQIQLAIETGNDIWLNFFAFLGCGTYNILEDQPDEYYTNIGLTTTLNDADLDEYMDSLVQTLNELEYPLDSNIKCEYSNEPWNFQPPFRSSILFAEAYGQQLKAADPNFPNDLTGAAGYLSARQMDAFEKALVRGGRESQVWTPIMGVQTANANLTRYQCRGAEYYVNNVPGVTFDMTRYVPSTTGYSYAPTSYKADNDVLGQAYANRADYYSELELQINQDPDEVSHKYLARQLEYSYINHTERVGLHKVEAAAFGINNPIQEYEGSDHNTSLNSEWVNNATLKDWLFEHRTGDPGAAIQRINTELFALNNPGGAVANFQIVGNADDPRYGAWFEGIGWSDLATSKTYEVWSDYIEPLEDFDAAQNWASYKAGLVGDGVVTVHPIYAPAVVVPSILINVIASDNDIDATEDDTDLVISGSVLNIEDGQIITVTVAGNNYTGSVSSGTWSVTVPMADVQAFDSSELVEANGSDAAGNTALTASRGITYSPDAGVQQSQDLPAIDDYVFRANGDSFIVGPTLGDLTSGALDALEFEGYVDFSSANGTWVSQTTSSFSNRELLVRKNASNITVYLGGSSNVYSINDIFGATDAIEGVLKIRFDYVNSETQFYLNDVLASTQPLAHGTGRIDGTFFRIGARSGENPDTGTTGGDILQNGAIVGSLSVTKYLTVGSEEKRLYEMPESGTGIIDSISGQDALLLSGDDGINDDFVLRSIPDIYGQEEPTPVDDSDDADDSGNGDNSDDGNHNQTIFITRKYQTSAPGPARQIAEPFSSQDETEILRGFFCLTDVVISFVSGGNVITDAALPAGVKIDATVESIQSITGSILGFEISDSGSQI